MSSISVREVNSLILEENKYQRYTISSWNRMTDRARRKVYSALKMARERRISEERRQWALMEEDMRVAALMKEEDHYSFDLKRSDSSFINDDGIL